MRGKAGKAKVGRVGPYASLRDAKLRTTLKMHDLCVFLISEDDKLAEEDILNAMFKVLNELENFYAAGKLQAGEKHTT